MADNVELNAGSGGAIIASDFDGVAQHQYVKIEFGDNDTQTKVTSSVGLPVDMTDDATRDLGIVTVDGTVTANLSTTDNTVLNNIDADTTTIAADTTEIAANYVADDSALGKGILIQGDDGTDRKNINVDATTGDVQVDVTNTVTVDLGVNNDVTLATLPDTATGDLATISGDTTSIDGKITACNTGAVVISSGTVTETNSTAILNDTANIDTNLGTVAGAVFTDDAAFTLASSKTMVAGAVRDDALSTLTAIEGDAVPLRVSSTGALHVTGGGGGTQYSVDDAGPTVVTMAGVVRDDSLTTLTEIDGDATVLRVSSTGALHVTGGGGGTEYTEDAVAATDPVGNATILVRADNPAALVSANGDNVAQRGTNFGAGYIQVVDSVGNFVDKFGGDVDVFGRSSVSDANNDIDIQFYKGAPSALLQVTTANSATAAANAGGALFSSSTNASGSVQGVTTQITSYRSGSEIYCMFTAAFTAGIANSYMRIGLYDANDGFFIGYEGTSFGVTYRNNTSDTTVAKASFSEDVLTAAAGSRFTRAGVAEAIDLTKLNVYRIRFGWLGSAPVYWEVMAPDGHWVCFHKTLFPNLQVTPSIQNPNLPMTLDITKTAAAATDITIQTDCWGAGTSVGSRAAQEDEYAFQTTALLNNGADYTTNVLALSPEFSQVQTSVLASHNGSIDIYWYSDAAGTDQVRLLTITYTASDGFQMFNAPAFTPFVKYKFTNNSGSNQTDFHFDTKFLRRPVNAQLLRVDGPVVGGMVAAVSRSLITASNGSNYVNVGATAGGNLKVSLQELSDGVDVGNGTVGTETLRVTIASDTTGVLSVDDNGGNLSIDLGGTAATLNTGVVDAGTQRVTLATDVALPTGDNNIGNVDIVTIPNVTVVGDAAHDAAVSGNPVLIGAESRTTEPTAVGNGDAVRVHATSLGKQVVYPYAIPASTWSYAAASGGITNDTAVTVKAAAGAGIRNYVTSVQVMNGHDTVGTEVLIVDGAAGTPLWRGWAEQTGGGCSAKFDPPLRGSANTLIEVDVGTTGSAIYFNLQGFTSAE